MSPIPLGSAASGTMEGNHSRGLNCHIRCAFSSNDRTEIGTVSGGPRLGNALLNTAAISKGGAILPPTLNERVAGVYAFLRRRIAPRPRPAMPMPRSAREAGSGTVAVPVPPLPVPPLPPLDALQSLEMVLPCIAT
jgi:hypothetical protein